MRETTDQGGDALSVCFNAVALLFLLEIDNYTYGFGLTDEMQIRLEVAGRSEMKNLDSKAVARMKVVHVCGACRTCHHQ